MRNYIFICFALTGLLAQAQDDPREPFLGHYLCSGYSEGYQSGVITEIKDTIFIVKKHPTDSNKIIGKWDSESNFTDKPLYFFPEDSSFDEWPNTPKHYEHGHFYSADSVYSFHFHSNRLGTTRYYLWGKWFKPLSTGIEELNFQVHIFPNPTKDRVQFSGVTPSSYVLYSLSGKQLKAGLVKNHEVSLHELPQGVYLLQLQVGEETVVKRIIKQ